MKMISISQGKIRLENKIIDLAAFQVRQKASEQDLNKHYGSFIEHVPEIENYFEDRNSFDNAVKDAASEKKPKLVAREPKYPFMWTFRASFMPLNLLNPSARRLHDDYFMVAHCLTRIPSKNKASKEDNNPPDEKLREDIAEKFKQYPGYEGIIEILNDRTQAETKSATFHESLHYVIQRYRAETGRNFVNAFIKESLPQLERYQAEYSIHERAVEILTDKLLAHDPDAQFENRWMHYSINDGFKPLAMGVSAIPIGLLLGVSFSYPYLLPLSLVPGRVRDYAIEKHKKSKRKEILKPIEYPAFKI